MDILDVFSWLPEKEMSIEQIENLVQSIESGISCEGYFVEHCLPKDANQYITEATDDLVQEGKKVCFLIEGKQIISVIGYR